MNLEKMIPEEYGQLENDDLHLSEGRIRRIFRENMDEEQTLDGDVPHVVNCVLSELLDRIIDETMDQASMMAKVKEAHMRAALRNVEVEEEYAEERRKFAENLEKIAEQMKKTADSIEERNR